MALPGTVSTLWPADRGYAYLSEMAWSPVWAPNVAMLAFFFLINVRWMFLNISIS